MDRWTRRHLLYAAVAVPAGAWMTTFRALAAPAQKLARITAVKFLQLDNVGDGCLVRIETDAGFVGYGEAGTDARTARARLARLESVLIGQDPLAIERIFYQMTAPQNPFIPQVGLVSGIDIALWDLAGKILGQPVHRLLGGPMRAEAPIYAHGRLTNMLDPVEAREWAQRAKAAPEGFRTFKFGPVIGGRSAGSPWAPTADGYDVRRVARAYANLREAAGDDLDIAMHGTGQFDLPTAIALAQAIEPMKPAWFEDPLNYQYSAAWRQLKDSTRVPILTGEKVELVAGFKPYLDAGAVDIIHPDPAYAGGITGVRKIADYAAVTRVPVALHVGPASMIRFYAAVQLSGAIHNFFRIENLVGEYRGFKEKMLAPGTEPVVRGGAMVLPAGPGLGLDLNEEWLKQHMAKGEVYWS